MDNSSTISRIYDLKTLGVSSVVSDIDKIIEKLNQLASVKRNISDAKSNIYDPAILSSVTAQLDKLNEAQAQTITELKELNTTTKQGVTAQVEYAAAQKGVTMSMEQSTTAMGNNLSATTAGLTKMQATIASTARTSVEYGAAITSLGTKLQQLQGDAESIKAEFKLLDAQLKDGQIGGEAYTQATIALTTELSQNKTQITEVTAAMTALNKVYNPALIAEENAQLAQNKVELQQRNQLLKLEAVERLAAANSINEARAQGALYRKELNDLDLTTEKGIARQKELIATIAELDMFIRENADLYTRQKINIGNYPTVQAEITALRAEMAKLVVAGKAESAEFAEMTARANQLAAATKLVKEETTEAATVGQKFGSIVERMGLRMIANLVVFQAAIELGTYLFEQWTKLSEAEEIAKDRLEDYNSALKGLARIIADMPSAIAAGISIDTENEQNQINIMTDHTQSIEARTDAYNKLLSVMPGLFHGMTEEEAMSEKNTIAIKNHAAAIIELQNNIKETTKARDAATKLLEQSKDSQTDLERTYSGTLSDPNPKKTAQIEDQTKKVKEYNAALADMSVKLARINSPELSQDKKKDKAEHDYTNAILEAQKKLTDGIAKEAELRLQIEMFEQKEIFDSVQHSLNERLKAYAIYATDEKRILQLQKEAAIKDVQDKLDKIADIEKKPKNKRTVEENTLLINKAQLSEQLNVLAADYKLKFENVSKSINSDIASIVKSDLDNQFKVIDTNLSKQLTAIADKYNEGKEGVYKSGRSKKYIDKHIGKLDEGAAVEGDEAKLIDDAAKINSTQLQMQQAHNAKLVDLERELREKLVALYKQEADDKNKLQADLNKNDGKKALEALKNGSLEIATTFANSYMDLLSKEDAYRHTMQERSLQWSMKVAQSNTQSRNEQVNLEKQHAAAERQIEHEKAQDELKRAKQTIAVSYVIASAKNFATNGGTDMPLALANEAVLTAEMLVQEAFLAKAPAYAKGLNPMNFAIVGDGYEPELMKIGNSWRVSPSTPTLINSAGLQSVTPFSQITNYSGTMGGQLQAPKFNSSSSGGGSNLDIQGLYGAIAQMAHGLSNQKVSLDTMAVSSKQRTDYHKKVYL